MAIRGEREPELVLVGWCLLWVAQGSRVPRLTSNLADADLAREHGQCLERRGHRVLAILEGNDLLDCIACR